MAILQVTVILLLATSTICFPMAYPGTVEDTIRLPNAPKATQETFDNSVTRGKRGYLTAASVAYPPFLTSAFAPAVPIVAPVLTSYSYFGHYGKPAIVPPPIYPHGYHGLSYYG